jgi:hypothetical protein
LRFFWTNKLKIVDSFLKAKNKKMALTYAGAILLKDEEEDLLCESEREWLMDILRNPDSYIESYKLGDF